MQKIIPGDNVPIKLWLDTIEDGALKQAQNLARLPFVFRHIAIMPDSHQGYGMPIGAVMATREAVVPNGVGVDIGCGMCAVQTNIPLCTVSQEDLKAILGGSAEYKGGIRSNVAFINRAKKVTVDQMPRPWVRELPNEFPIVANQFERARNQMGTLGGGNHFIEIQKGNDGYIWLMIHSGSRNLGHTVATHYNKVAVKLNEIMHTVVPKERQLAFLPVDSMEGARYLGEMAYCIEYAKMNRASMMNEVYWAVKEIFPGVTFGDLIDVCHNFAALENHFGQNVWVHRKGATKAYEGEFGIIPGSQGTHSYIVKGLGNIESFKSCSHGAGRKMSRTEAKNTLDMDIELAKLDGVLHTVRGKAQLDEAPGSYKSIATVMRNQRDLVLPEVELTPLAVIKG